MGYARIVRSPAYVAGIAIALMCVLGAAASAQPGGEGETRVAKDVRIHRRATVELSGGHRI